MNVGTVYAQTTYHYTAPYPYEKRWYNYILGTASCQVDGENGKIYVYADAWSVWAKGQGFLGYYITITKPSHISIKVSFTLNFKLFTGGWPKDARVWVSVQVYSIDNPPDSRTTDEYGRVISNPDDTAIEKHTVKIFYSGAQQSYSYTSDPIGFSTLLEPGQYIVVASFAGHAAYGGKVTGYSGKCICYNTLYRSHNIPRKLKSTKKD